MSGRTPLSGRRWIAGVCLMLTTGCSRAADPAGAPPGNAVTSAAPGRSDTATAPVAPREPVAPPDLSALAPAVQRQIRDRYEALVDAGSNSPSDDDRAARYGELGHVLLAATFFDQAVLAYRHAEVLRPADMRWPYLRAHALLRNGDRDGAAAAFARAIALAPGYVPALVWLGDVTLDLGRTEAARAAFDRAVAAQPDSAAVQFGAGRAALAAAAYPEAIVHLERARALDPQASAIAYPLASAYRSHGDIQRADALLQARGTAAPVLDDPVLDAATIVLDSSVSYEALGMEALRKQDWNGAVRAFRRGLDLAPDDAALRYWMASAMIAGGDATGAEREFRAIVAAHPDFAKAHFSLGALAAQQGRRDEAAQQYALAVQHDPTMVDARVRLGDAERARQRLRPALAQYEAAVQLDPNAAAAWVGGGQVLLALGERERARDWIAQGRRLHPSRPEWNALARELTAVP